ncbi:hypothetical protein QTN25_005148 [Entamoeba marina]
MQNQLKRTTKIKEAANLRKLRCIVQDNLTIGLVVGLLPIVGRSLVVRFPWKKSPKTNGFERLLIESCYINEIDIALKQKNFTFKRNEDTSFKNETINKIVNHLSSINNLGLQKNTTQMTKIVQVNTFDGDEWKKFAKDVIGIVEKRTSVPVTMRSVVELEKFDSELIESFKKYCNVTGRYLIQTLTGMSCFNENLSAFTRICLSDVGYIIPGSTSSEVEEHIVECHNDNTTYESM